MYRAGEIDTKGHGALTDWRNNAGTMTNLGNIGGSMVARVLKVDWQKRTLDCIGMHHQMGAGPWVGVPIASSVMTQTEGVHWIPDIEIPDIGEMSEISQTAGRDDAVAIIIFIGNNIRVPICVGFISVGPHEFSFDEPGTKIERHTSDIYNRTTKNGTYEFSFPDGTYVKVAPTVESELLEDLSGKNYHADKRPWEITPDDPRFIVVKHASGTRIFIDQEGNINISSPTSIAVTSPQVSISGTSGDVIINGVSLVNHYHNYTDSNGNNSVTHGTTSPIQ